MKAKFFGRLVSCLLAIVASMALGGCGAESKDAQSQDVGTSSAGVSTGMRLQIKSMSSQKCLDVAGGYTNPDNPIVQFTCHHGLNQQFQLYDTFNGFQIQSMLDLNMCVSIKSAWWNELVYLEPCVDANGWRPYTTRWYLDSSDLWSSVSHAELRTVAAPRGTQQYCIDVASGLTWDSLWMQIYGCHHGLNQQWELSNW